ncbi:MAG: AAA family ATPase [Bacteroidota bacterium]
MRIHIFGASGSGTTTLGKALAPHLGWMHLDADDFYWKRTNPPYQQKIPLEQRNASITSAIEKYKSVIISGSMVSWGEQWKLAVDLAVFLYIPQKIRMERLRKRETARYGNLLYSDENIKANTSAFLEWAVRYDDKKFTGRSISQHELWITQLTCTVLKIEGDTSVKERVDLVLEQLRILKKVTK